MDKNEVNFKPKSWKETQESIEKLTDEYMPPEGKSNTLLGEMMRALNQIIYRYYNDGDCPDSGYGMETVAPACMYLLNLVWGEQEALPKGNRESDWVREDVAEIIAELFKYSTDRTYKDLLKALANSILTLIEQDFEYFSETENNTDMWDFEIVDWNGNLLNSGKGARIRQKLERVAGIYLYDEYEDEEDEEDEEDW